MSSDMDWETPYLPVRTPPSRRIRKKIMSVQAIIFALLVSFEASAYIEYDRLFATRLLETSH